VKNAFHGVMITNEYKPAGCSAQIEADMSFFREEAKLAENGDRI
jgi:hypothetical protein